MTKVAAALFGLATVAVLTVAVVMVVSRRGGASDVSSGNAPPTGAVASASTATAPSPTPTAAPPSPTATAAAPSPTPTAAPPSPTATAAAPSPTATAPVVDLDQVEVQLKAAALKLEDLPKGFTLQEEKFTSNEDEAQKGSDTPNAPTLDDLNRFGRILGYQADYTRPAPATLTGATVVFGIETDAYQDSKGAAEDFEATRREVSDPAFAEGLARQEGGSDFYFSDVTISPMSFAKVGDDRMAFEIKCRIHYTDPDRVLDFYVQGVGVRRGRAAGFITAAAIGSPHPRSELEDLARTLDKRLKDTFK